MPTTTVPGPLRHTVVRPREADAWVRWLQTFGMRRFYRAFVEHAQDAESRCTQCGLPIYLDVVEGGGVPDWRTADGDYGCRESPDTAADGVGSHRPRKL